MHAKSSKVKSEMPSKKDERDVNDNQFPIVAIGASAGGLEALEQFFSNVPDKCGLTFVVIQHLDPTQRGMLPELLQRVTRMNVLQVEDHMKVISDCVYVIPPNKSMSILKRVLYLLEPVESRGLRLPIDFFFRSLADDQQEFSIGLVLSGMGSDGTEGLRAIKEKNGIAMVQEPSTAKYDSMPRSAMESVNIDIVAPVTELPAKLLDLLKHFQGSGKVADLGLKDKSSLEKIIILLRNRTGNDFSLYKNNTVYRRIERRMSIHNIEHISTYVHFLQENPSELDILFKELMIGVTKFFRDAKLWEKLRDIIIPDMLARLPEGSIARAWVPGCSTGEEAYSLAIVFKEAIEKNFSHGGFSLQVFATDLDQDAIGIARKGVFPVSISEDVSSNRLNRFFNVTDEGYRLNTEIREMVVFAQHNIIMHPPFTRIDILSCRNLLIYLNSELQRKLIGLFYYSLNQDGIMVLGTSETLGTQSHIFTAIDTKLKIFRRIESNMVTDVYNFPSSFSRNLKSNIVAPMPLKSTSNIQTIADQLLLQHFAPSGVLVNENGDIIYISGHTGKYLEPAVGKANLNIFAMLREGLREEFPLAFRKAIISKESVVLHNIKVGTNGGTRTININIQLIDKPESLRGTLLIVFIDVPEIHDSAPKVRSGSKALKNTRYAELEQELQHVREQMQSTLEEMQTSQEELKSTNEELQSTNEELQSTNEELTTSKEEMQSLNEELQTVNAELQSKVDEFSRVNNDMKNLLNSTDIATLFLDKELKIRRYTNQSTKIFKLIKSDIGRPLTDLVSELIFPELASDALEVLRTLVFIQKIIPAKDGRWFSVRIMPYRTFDDRIDGLVITFFNISDLKEVEIKLQQTERINRLLVNTSSDIIVKLAYDLKIIEFNPEAEKFFGKKYKETANQSFIQMFIPEEERNKVNNNLKKLLNGVQDGKLKMQVIGAGGKMQTLVWFVYILHNKLNTQKEIVLTPKRQAQYE
jgi:two-component system, chemotaxis family, CheB/CheR fusion protein